jgi:hypothetical protein
MAEILTEELSFGRYKYGYGTDGTQIRKFIWIDEDGSFTPAELFDGGVAGAWYDPSDLSTMFQDDAGTIPVTADNDPVGRLLDKSGNGNHLTQSTAGSRPTYQTAGGMHWLAFDGVDDYLTGTLPVVSMGGNISKTAFAAQVTGAPGTIYHYGDVAVNNQSFGFRRDNNNRFVMQWGADLSSISMPTASPEVWAGLKNGNNISLRTNGVADGGPTDLGASNLVTNTFNLGRRLDGVEVLAGEIYGFIIVAGVTAGADLTNTEAYLAAKMGITL